MKKILIAGANSYIGDSFKAYLELFPNDYIVDILETKGLKPSPDIFLQYDTVFCVAGIAHIKETTENRHLYFDVNRDLVVKIAKEAKSAGVKQFILLSSMSVYGMETGIIKKTSQPNPKTAYGESKLQADLEIQKIETATFKFACLRPPMVYGKNCKGNYQTLRKFALKSPIFPSYENKRSMIYIGNLCEFIKNVIDFEKNGLFFPQNAEYTNTSLMVKDIAKNNNKKIIFTNIFNWLIRIVRTNIVQKVFGDLIYEHVDTVDKYSLKESIALTEGDIS